MTQDVAPRQIVIGPGAVGSLLAAALARKAERVWLAGSASPSPGTAAHLAAIAKGGLQVEGDEAYLSKLSIMQGPEGPPAETLLFAVKAHRLAAAARLFSPLVDSRTKIAVLSNGIDVCAELPEKWPRANIVRGLVMTGAERAAAGRVRQLGPLSLSLAPAYPEAGEAAVAVAELFERGGARVVRGADGPAEEWKKAMANIVINPLGALLERRNGELLEHPAAALFRLLTGEAQEVSDARGFGIDVLAIAEAAARQTAQNRNSMWQDLIRGQETEIGALTGKFVEIAEKAGFEVPGHRAVLLGVRAMEKAEKMPTENG